MKSVTQQRVVVYSNSFRKHMENISTLFYNTTQILTLILYKKVFLYY